MSSHSRFAPSSAKRWMHCPGSMTLESQYPDSESSVYAREGSAVHLLNEMRLKKALSAQALTNSKGKKIKEIAPLLHQMWDGELVDFLDVEITEEMIDCCQDFVAWVQSQLPPGCSTANQSVIESEKRLVTDIDPEISGTSDVTIRDWPLTLHVIDYKHGVGDQVEAVDAPQLAIYALGALAEYGTDFGTVKMTIYQPRGAGETIRTWELPLRKFYADWKTKVTNAHRRCLVEKTTYIPGSWCKWCMGAHVCPKAKGGFDKMVKVNAIVPSAARELSKVLGLECAVLEYLNKCKAQAFKLLSQGTSVPGFKLVQTWGREKWSAEKLVIGAMDNGLLDKVSERKLKTPKQIRKILGKRYPKELDKLTTTPNNGAKLVPDTDKRKAIVPAAEVFDDHIDF